jgi:hypothetical protein
LRVFAPEAAALRRPYLLVRNVRIRSSSPTSVLERTMASVFRVLPIVNPEVRGQRSETGFR